MELDAIAEKIAVASVLASQRKRTSVPQTIGIFRQSPDGTRVVVSKKVRALEIGVLAATVDVSSDDGPTKNVPVGIYRRLCIGNLCAERLVIAQLALTAAPAVVPSWQNNINLFPPSLIVLVEKWDERIRNKLASSSCKPHDVSCSLLPLLGLLVRRHRRIVFARLRGQKSSARGCGTHTHKSMDMPMRNNSGERSLKVPNGKKSFSHISAYLRQKGCLTNEWIIQRDCVGSG